MPDPTRSATRILVSRVTALLGAALLLGAAVGARAEAAPDALGAPPAPLWLRHSAISPDGQQIAFAFEGNLFVVPAAGGTARLLVGNGRHSTAPVWSPDGRRVAYASDTFGNFDVFVVAADGGPSRRLTTHSAPETPLAFTPDGSAVYFSAQRLDARTSIGFPSRAVSELYTVSVEPGRRPKQVLTTPGMALAPDRAGTRLLYEDWKGYESAWRKHHVSPVAHDIWLYDTAARTHRQLTTFGGEDRDPVWSPDEQSVYWLSERSGSFNVWKMPIADPSAAVQVTRFEKNPVRFLSISKTGVLAFGYDGELWTLQPGASAPGKVQVRIAADLRAARVENLKSARGATEVATSPDGQEVAFVLRGQVFVASSEFGDTKRVTDSPGQSRSVSFSPDGRRLLFATEAGGRWQLQEATVADDRKASPYFFSSARVQVKTLLKNDHENFQPRWSPDGKEVAYLEDRVTLKVLTLATGQTRTVLPGRWNYSYSDGDQWFDWSPDGRWFLVDFVDAARWGTEVGLIDAQGTGPLLNLTRSGYDDDRPMWTRGGQSMMWLSDRMGLHGTGGAAQRDLFAMFFTRDALDRYRLSKSEYALLQKQEDEDKKAADEKQKRERGDPDRRDPQKTDRDRTDAAVQAARAKAGLPDDAPKLPEPVRIERENLEDRTARLTPNSGKIRAMAMTPDGETLFYATENDGGVEVWVDRLRAHEAKKFADIPAGPRGRDDPPVDLVLDAKGENGFVLASGQIRKFKVPKDEKAEVKAEPLAFSAEMRLDRSAERAQMFDHVWRQTQQKLYVADMGGVDWAYYRTVYARFLPFVADNHDFAELLSEMLGELNVSHTGASYRPVVGDGDNTAALGVFLDEAWAGAGLKIAEIVEGGPLSNAKSGVRAGMVVERIDGEPIAPGAEFDSLLNRKAGRRVELAVFDPASGRRFAETVKPVTLGEQNELLYKRWVKTERALVERLSGGKLGYVHVRGMDDESYRDAFSDILGRYSDRQALIVDTRFNGGGNLHDALTSLLSGRKYLEFLPRGQSLGWEPTSRWTQPSIVVMSESNYSDAHLFPWLYRELGIGKLLGMPVAGTGTAVWWETLQDDTLVFGIPEVGYRDRRGNFMERALIEPDYRVPNEAGPLAEGRDQQIEAAVKVLLGG